MIFRKLRFFLAVLTIGSSQAASAEISESEGPCDDPIVVVETIVANNPCAGSDNGSISLDISGGTPPYDVSWNTGSPDTEITGLSGGGYVVTIIDANDCDLLLGYTVPEAEPLSLENNTAPIACNGETTITTLIVTGGSGPFEYLWNDGSTNPNIANAGPGDYDVTVTDASGCEESISFSLSEPDAITASSTSTDVACFGGTGSAIVEASGGVPPLTIDWIGLDPNNLPAADYVININDASGCSIVYQFTINQAPTFNAEVNTINPNCFGENGTALAEISGGTFPYDLDWEGNDPTDLPAGNYNLIVTDGNDCSITVPFEIVAPPELNVEIGTTAAPCFGENGTATLLISGGTAPHQIEWAHGPTDPFLDDLPAGEYSVSITDAELCSITETVTINQPDELDHIIAINHTTCGEENGSATITANGGTPPYSYLWSNETEEATASNLGAGVYTVTITDLLECSIEVELEVLEIVPFTVDTETIQHLDCYEDNDGLIALNINGGTEPFTFLWSNGATELNIADLAAGVYELSITDAATCSETLTYEITQPDPLLISQDVDYDPCVSEIGDITINPYGGTAPYTILWEDGSTEEFLEIDHAGQYPVSVSDANGCTYQTVITALGDPIGGTICFQIPSGFSPNGDMINDLWEVRGIESFENNNVQIFNKWGQRVMYSAPYQGDWDGLDNGNDLPSGTYYYIIDLGNGTRLFKGNVSIKR